MAPNYLWIGPMQHPGLYGSNNLNNFYYKRKKRAKHPPSFPMDFPSAPINKVGETDRRRGGGHGSAEEGAYGLGGGGQGWAGHLAHSPGPGHHDHIGWNTEFCTLTATVCGCVLRSVARKEDHASGWPGWLPHPTAFSVPGSIESSQLPAGSQGI